MSLNKAVFKIVGPGVSQVGGSPQIISNFTLKINSEEFHYKGTTSESEVDNFTFLVSESNSFDDIAATIRSMHDCFLNSLSGIFFSINSDIIAKEINFSAESNIEIFEVVPEVDIAEYFSRFMEYEIDITSDLAVTHTDIGFAFNPITITVSDIVNDDVIILESNGLEIEKEKDDNNTIYFNVSAIARSLFDRREFHIIKENDDILLKVLNFTLKNSKGVLYQGSISVIWGALQIGEKYTQVKTLTNFEGYPFTIPIYLENQGVLYFTIDGGNYYGFKTLDKGKYNFSIDDVLEATGPVLVMPKSKIEFFTGTPISPIGLLIKVTNCPNDGIYLRWINQHGEYNYYLFTPSTRTVSTQSLDVKFDNVYYTTDLTDNYHHGTGTSIGKNISSTVRLFASLVDEDDYHLLSGLVKSSVVDLFVGYNQETQAPQWVNVTIQDGTFAQSTNNLQDFECNLIPDKELIQTL